MATNNNNASLFGEDTDSSDESVGATKPTTTTGAKIGGDDDDEGDEVHKKEEEASASAGAGDKEETTAAEGEGKDATTTASVSEVPSKKDEEGSKKEEKDDDEKNESDEKPAAASGGSSTPSKNAALFGDDSSSEDEDEFDGNDDGIVGRSGGATKKPSVPAVGRSMNEKLGLDSDSDGEREGAKSDEAGDKEGEEEKEKKYVPPRRTILQDLPGINRDPQNKPEYHITKLPNLVGIQPKPYDPKTYDREQEEEEYRGYVHNMIRWRYKKNEAGEIERDEEGHPIRESNTRIVKWSDGSYTLHIGSEVLEVDNLDSSIPMDNPDPAVAGFAGINGYLYVSQKAKIHPPCQKEMDGPPPDGKEVWSESELEKEEDRPEPKPAGTVLECIGKVSSRLALRPSSLASEAHRNLKLTVQKRNVKRARIAEIVTEVDPEKEKLARIKGKEDLAKAKNRSGSRRSGGGGGRSRRGMNASYLEEEEGYEGVNLSRLKKRTMRREEYSDEDDEMDYGEDSDEEEEEEWMSKKKRKRGAAAARASSAAKEDKPAKDDESSEEGEVVFGDDSDDDEEDAFVKKRAGAAKKAVFGDDDDD